jgi:general secretion pathway protein G
MTRKRTTRRLRRSGRHGFTLMEVLLVLAILVIMGTFAVTNFSKVFAGAKVKSAQTQINHLIGPLNMYQMDIGTFPDNNQGLNALRVAPPDLTDPTKWNGPYLGKDIPKDPWENSYYYERLAPKEYRIYSAGPDGQPGTDDDIIGGDEGF